VTGINLSGSDAGNYTPNASTSTTADITQRALTITATGVNRQYNGLTNATVTLGDDRVSGDVFTSGYTSASFGDKNVGTGKPVSVSGISISGTDAGNYSHNSTANSTADITARPLVVSATGVNKAYDGNATATVTLADDRLSGDLLTPIYTSATFNNKNVGVNKPVSVTGIGISGTDAGNYTPNTTANTTASILRSPLMLALVAVSDGTTTTLTVSDNRRPGDDVTVNYAAATYGDHNTVEVSGITLRGADARNYSIDASASAPVSGVAKGDIKVQVRGEVGAPVAALDKMENPGVAVAAVAGPALPAKFGMDGNAPNPFQSATSIRFRLPEPSKVTLAVYDAQGRIQERLVSGEMPAGDHVASWSGRSLNGLRNRPGVYFVRMDATSLTSSKEFHSQKTMMMVK
jgi:hypothetical protein